MAQIAESREGVIEGSFASTEEVGLPGRIKDGFDFDTWAKAFKFKQSGLARKLAEEIDSIDDLYELTDDDIKDFASNELGMKRGFLKSKFLKAVRKSQKIDNDGKITVVLRPDDPDLLTKLRRYADQKDRVNVILLTKEESQLDGQMEEWEKILANNLIKLNESVKETKKCLEIVRKTRKDIRTMAGEEKMSQDDRKEKIKAIVKTDGAKLIKSHESIRKELQEIANQTRPRMLGDWSDQWSSKIMGDGIEIVKENPKQLIVPEQKGRWLTCWGTNEVDLSKVHKGVYVWCFKVVHRSSVHDHAVGICRIADVSVSKKHKQIGNYWKYFDTSSGSSGGFQCKNGDRVEMRLDATRCTLEFKINGSLQSLSITGISRQKYVLYASLYRTGSILELTRSYIEE